MPDENDDDEAYFSELLEKKGDTWLANALTKLGVKLEAPKPPQPTGSQPAGEGFVTFLSGELADLKAAFAKRGEQLERALDMLTSEQRQILRQSLIDGDAARRNLPPTKKPQEPPAAPPKKSFLQRL